MKRIVALTGAGMSAESGLSTFRDSGGLWDKYRIEEVATPEAWHNNKQLVLDFYNLRRAQLGEVAPNQGHFDLVALEEDFEVTIITQNVDDLHERAGSRKVIHLHGELTKVRSVKNPKLVQDIGYASIGIGDLAPDGEQLRPHIVWFGEEVPKIAEAIPWVEQADILVVIGTSLNVYPAAGLIDYTSASCKLYLIDPNEVRTTHPVTFIREDASTGVQTFSKTICHPLSQEG